MSEIVANPANVGASSPLDGSSRRTWLGFVVLAVALIAVVGSVFARARRPALTPEEVERVGTWYGYIHEGERHYCWLTELRRDRTCRISFRNYFAFPEDEDNAEPDRFIATDVNESRGTWRISGTDYVTETWYPESDPGTVTRVWVWLRDQQWLPRHMLTFGYRVQDAPEGHFVYTLNSEEVTFHAVRVPEDFKLPGRPLDNDAALASWQKSHGPDSTAEGSSP